MYVFSIVDKEAASKNETASNLVCIGLFYSTPPPSALYKLTVA
jgi:hypothetical protein